MVLSFQFFLLLSVISFKGFLILDSDDILILIYKNKKFINPHSQKSIQTSHFVAMCFPFFGRFFRFSTFGYLFPLQSSSFVSSCDFYFCWRV